MTAIQSKSAFLYREVRHALRSGRYLPGERIDPATLAETFHASPTPVRFGFMRILSLCAAENWVRNQPGSLI